MTEERQIRELEPPPSRRGALPGGRDHEAEGRLPIRPAPNSRLAGSWRLVPPRLRPGLWFLSLALPAGLVLLFLTPPFQGLDEINHFARVYTISQGELVARHYQSGPGGYIPTCVADWTGFEFRPAGRHAPYDPANFWRQPTPCSPGATSFALFPNTAFYSPVSYLPQIFGVLVTRSLGAPVPVIFYAGRLAALLAFLGVVFLSLYIAPRAHTLMVLVGAWPMTLLLAASYSADTMTIAFAFLMVAGVLRAREEPEAWGPAAIAFLGALGLAVCKETYFALAPAILLVPARMFSRRSLSWLVKAAALVAVAIATWGWYTQVAAEAAAPGGGLNPHAQEMLILHKPLWYLHFVVNMEFTGTGYPTWETLIAQVGFFRNFVQGEPFAPPWVLILGLVLLVLAYAREAKDVRWSGWSVLQGAMPVALVTVNFLLIYTSGFVEEVLPTHLTLTISGKYLLPFLLVLVLTFAVLSPAARRPRSVLPFLPFLGVMLVWLVSDVHLAFYG